MWMTLIKYQTIHFIMWKSPSESFCMSSRSFCRGTNRLNKRYSKSWNFLPGAFASLYFLRNLYFHLQILFNDSFCRKKTLLIEGYICYKSKDFSLLLYNSLKNNSSWKSCLFNNELNKLGIIQLRTVVRT